MRPSDGDLETSPQGGHRGAQLVGRIRREPPQMPHRRLQAPEEAIQDRRQPVDLRRAPRHEAPIERAGLDRLELGSHARQLGRRARGHRPREHRERREKPRGAADDREARASQQADLRSDADRDLAPAPSLDRIPDHAIGIAAPADGGVVGGRLERRDKPGDFRWHAAGFSQRLSSGRCYADQLPGTRRRFAADVGNRPLQILDRGNVPNPRQRLRLLLDRRVERAPHRLLDENQHADGRRHDDDRGNARKYEHQLPTEATRRSHRDRLSRMNPAPRMVCRRGARPPPSSFRRRRLTCTSTRFERPS